MSAAATFWAWSQAVGSVSQKAVLLCLADCHNQETKQCNPSIPLICDRTRCNRKTVIKAIGQLEEVGLVSVFRGGRSGNQYSLNLGMILSEKFYHFVYKTTDRETGEYYIGLHSSKSLTDGYKGSGYWVSKHRDETSLDREILMSFDTRDQAIGAESAIIASCINDEKCMNRQPSKCSDFGTKTTGTIKNGTVPKEDIKSPKNDDLASQKRHPNLKESKKNLKDIYRKLSLAGIDDSLLPSVKEFIDHRVNLKKPLTQDALHRFLITVEKTSLEVSMAPSEVIAETIDAGWQSIKPDWMKNRIGGRANGPDKPANKRLSEVDRVRESNAKRAAEREKTLSGRREAADDGGGFLGADDGDIHPHMDKQVRGHTYP